MAAKTKYGFAEVDETQGKAVMDLKPVQTTKIQDAGPGAVYYHHKRKGSATGEKGTPKGAVE